MSGLLQDFRHGFRMFARNPGLWALAVVTLALGIGANASVFSLIRGILLKPLSVFDHSKHFIVWSANPAQGRERQPASWTEFEQWRSSVTAADELVGMAISVRSLGGDAGDPERIQVAAVTPGFFEFLNSAPAQGRSFDKEEFQSGRETVAVISDGLWKRRYASDPRVAGKTIRLGSETYTIVGVAQRDFWYPSSEVQMWVPAVPQRERAAQMNRQFEVIGSLKPGAPLQQVQSEIDAAQKRLGGLYPETHAGWVATVHTPWGMIYPSDRIAIGLVHGVALGVLIIACSNLAILLLARSVMRQREMAIRQSLGAERWRLIRQSLIESLWLALPAAGLGILLAKWSSELLVRGFPTMNVPVPDQLVDWTVVAFTLACAVSSVLIFGLAPAWQGSKLAISNALKEAGARSGGASRKTRRLSSIFVVAQTALALALVSTAALSLKGMVALHRMDLGFPSDRAVMARVSPASWRYEKPEQVQAFYDRAIQEIAAVPGVRAVGALTIVPQVQGDGIATTFAPQDRPAPEAGRKPVGHYLAVSARAIDALQVPMLRGRFIEARDHASAERVAVISQLTAKTFWPDRDPIGQKIVVDAAGKEPFTIVGVAGDVKSDNFRSQIRPKFYLPMTQAPARAMTILVRTTGSPEQSAPAIREALRRVDREEPAEIHTIEERLLRNMEGGRTFVSMVVVFGALALFMAALGLFCLLSYSVSQRMPEIGIRMALGAAKADVVRLVAMDCVRMLAIGGAIGLVLSVLLGRLIASLMVDMSAADPAVLGISIASLLAAGLVAVFAPARRAASADPAVVLRNE